MCAPRYVRFYFSSSPIVGTLLSFSSSVRGNARIKFTSKSDIGTFRLLSVMPDLPSETREMSLRINYFKLQFYGNFFSRIYRCRGGIPPLNYALYVLYAVYTIDAIKMRVCRARRLVSIDFEARVPVSTPDLQKSRSYNSFSYVLFHMLLEEKEQSLLALFLVRFARIKYCDNFITRV